MNKIAPIADPQHSQPIEQKLDHEKRNLHKNNKNQIDFNQDSKVHDDAHDHENQVSQLKIIQASNVNKNSSSIKKQGNEIRMVQQIQYNDEVNYTENQHYLHPESNQVNNSGLMDNSNLQLKQHSSNLLPQQSPYPKQKQKKGKSSSFSTSGSTSTNTNTGPPSKMHIFAIVATVLLVVALVVLIVVLVYVYPTRKTIAIMGTNDLHGRVFPTPLFRADTGQPYKYGGLVYLATIMDVVKNEYNGNLLYLDAGDQFQGGIQASKLVSNGQIMNDWYKRVDLGASVIGNHQFDFGPEFLLNYLNGREMPNLMANLRSQVGTSDFLPYQKGQYIYQFANGIKIGVIGLITTQTPTTTATFINGKFPRYQFLTYPEIVKQKAASLRLKGADAIILLAHAGNSCVNNFSYGKWTKQTAQNNCPYDQITQLIDQLPEGTIQAVIQGHRHRIAHYYYKGIPFMGVINGGYYANFMYLTFDQDRKIVDSMIEGPVPVCQKVFEATNRCDYLDAQAIQTAGNLIPYYFHNTKVVADPQLSATLTQKYSSKMALYTQFLVNNEMTLIAVRDQQSALGNLFTKLLKDLVPDADFTILNSGGFRTQWYPGVINYQLYYNMFPFDNTISTFTITGQQLIDSLVILQSGLQFFAMHNLKITVSIQNSTNTRTVTSVSFHNGTAINPAGVYKGVTIKYLLDGGDRFSQVIGTVYNATNVVNIGEFRSTLKPYLKAVGTIRNALGLVDPANPRILITYV